jgi:hypothetical protein
MRKGCLITYRGSQVQDRTGQDRTGRCIARQGRIGIWMRWEVLDVVRWVQRARYGMVYVLVKWQ